MPPTVHPGAPTEQLQAIQAMLAAGHRSVHLERHSLVLIGGVGGFLSLATEWVITDTRFPDVQQRGLALLVWLAVWLGGMAWLDHGLTRRARARRAETLPFAQAQVTRAWWMLLAVGCLGSFAMFFHGDGLLIYALWTVLLGLGIYIYGLFSRLLIEWIGLSTILLGVMGLAAGLPYQATQWLNAACFAIGMPLAGWLNARWGDAEGGRRLAVLALWLTAVVTPALVASHAIRTSPPGAVRITDPAALGPGEQVLRLEAGSRVPLRLTMDSPILALPEDAALDMTLRLPVEVALRDGKPDGRYRVGDGPWHSIRDGNLRVGVYRLAPGIGAGQPEVRAQTRLRTLEPEGDAP